jgi:hypothetical protein
MKIIALSMLFVAVAAANGRAEATRKDGDERDVIVGRLPQPIPEVQKEAEKYIWDFFAKRPEKSFRQYSTKDWRRNFDSFSRALVAKAKELRFEAESLEDCLRRLPNEPWLKDDKNETAYLPIEAYRTTQGKHQVWVIFCLWEYAFDPDTPEAAPPTLIGDPTPPRPAKREWLHVGHICIFTYDILTKEVVGFVRCD